MGDSVLAYLPSLYQSFLTHGSERRSYTELVIIQEVKRSHPGDHVLWLNAEGCDLLEFANAGLAKARLISPDLSFAAIRTYEPSSNRLRDPEGTLKDKFIFAHYDYRWKESSFNCYRIGWQEDPWTTRDYFAIVSPSAAVDEEGHCKAADDLATACGKWSDTLHDEIYVFEDGDWVKNKPLWRAVEKSSWDDVIINPETKKAIIKDVETFFDSEATYAEYNVPWKRGMIFHGAPGCGKTISIKTIMRSVQAKDVCSLYVKSFRASGCRTDEYSINEIFRKARAMAPCLLIFEDLDSIVTDKLRSYFLNQVDGIEDNNGIMMIGSTNHLERLDPAISKRPSRFDRKYHYALPGEHERFLYCQYWQKKLSSNSSIELNDEVCKAITVLTDGFSFAYLKELFVQTLLTIVSGRSTVGTDIPENEGEFEPPAVPYETFTHLETNHFFRVLRQQLAVLLKELHHSPSDEAKTEDKNDSSTGDDD